MATKKMSVGPFRVPRERLLGTAEPASERARDELVVRAKRRRGVVAREVPDVDSSVRITPKKTVTSEPGRVITRSFFDDED